MESAFCILLLHLGQGLYYNFHADINLPVSAVDLDNGPMEVRDALGRRTNRRFAPKDDQAHHIPHDSCSYQRPSRLVLCAKREKHVAVYEHNVTTAVFSNPW